MMAGLTFDQVFGDREVFGDFEDDEKEKPEAGQTGDSYGLSWEEAMETPGDPDSAQPDSGSIREMMGIPEGEQVTAGEVEWAPTETSMIAGEPPIMRPADSLVGKTLQRSALQTFQSYAEMHLRYGNLGRDMVFKKLEETDPEKMSKLDTPEKRWKYLVDRYGNLGASTISMPPEKEATFRRASDRIQATVSGNGAIAMSPEAQEWMNLKSPKWWAENTGRVFTDLAKYIGMNIATSGVGTIMMAGEATGMFARETRDRFETEDYDPENQLTMTGEATLMLGVNSVLSYLPLEALKFGPSAAKTLLGSVASQIAKKTGMGAGKAAISVTAAAGVAEEVGQVVAERMVRHFVEHDPEAFTGMGKEALQAGFLSGIATGAMKTGQVAAQGIANRGKDMDNLHRAAMQGREIMEKEGGIDKLTELGLKKEPTIDDFSKAGFDVEALDLSPGNMKILSDQFATVSKPLESPTTDPTIDLTTRKGLAVPKIPKAPPFEPVTRETLPDAPAKSRRQIVRDTMRAADIHIVEGDFSVMKPRKAAGYYRWINAFKIPGRELAIDKKYLADIGVSIHEVAHFFDDKFNITGRKKEMGREVEPGLMEKMGFMNPANARILDKISSYDYDHGRRALHEGFAEVVRLYTTATDPRNVLDSEVIDFIETSIFTEPEIGSVINATRADVLRYDAQSDFDKLNHTIHSPESEIITPDESFFARKDSERNIFGIKNLFARAVQKKLQNDQRNLEKSENEMERVYKEHWKGLSKNAQRGVTDDQAWNNILEQLPGKASQLRYSAFSATSNQYELAITDGIFDPTTGKRFGNSKSVQEIFEVFEGEEGVKKFGTYLQSKVGLERKKRAVAKGEQYLVGEADASLQNFVNEIESGPDADKYSTAAREVTEVFNDLVRLQVHHGRISPAAGDAIVASHEIYMPLLRVSDDTGAGKGSKGSPFKRLGKGSTKATLDIRDAIIHRMQSVYSDLNQGEIEGAYVDMASLSGVGSPFVTKILNPGTAVSKLDSLQGMVNEGLLTTESADLLNVDDSVDPTDFVSGRGFQRGGKGHGIFSRWKDGKQETYKIDPDVYDVISKVNNPALAEDAGVILELISFPTRVSKYSWVTANIFRFLPKNWWRDMKTATIKGLQDVRPEEKSTGAFWRMQKEYGRGAKQFFGGETSDVDKLLHRAGLTRQTRLRTSEQAKSKGVLAKARHRKFRRETFGKSVKRRKRDIVTDALVRTLDTIEAMNNVIELAPRKAAAIQTLMNIQESAGGFKINKDGSITGEVPRWAETRATNNGLEATVNFSRRGEWAAGLDIVMPFFNAGVQGTTSQIMTIGNAVTKAKSGDRRHLNRIMANVAVGMAGQIAALVYMMNTEDEDGLNHYELYRELNKDKRRDYTIVPVMLPMLGTMHFTFPKEREWKPFSNAVDILAEMIWSRKKHEDPKSVRKEIVDMLTNEAVSRLPGTGGFYSAMVQVKTGYNVYFNRQIENARDRAHSSEFRYNEYTSSAAKLLGSTGFAKWTDASPKEIDFVLRNTIGSMPFGTADWLQTGDITEAPFISPFLGKGVPRESVNDLYIESERNRQKLNDYMKGYKEYTDDQLKEMRNREVLFGVTHDIFRLIRDTDENLIDGKRKARLMTGLARWATGRPDDDAYPNPINLLFTDKIPPQLAREVDKTLRSAFGKPSKTRTGTERGVKRYRQQEAARAKVGRETIQQIREKRNE